MKKQARKYLSSLCQIIVALKISSLFSESLCAENSLIPWERATQPHEWQFPRDHGAHPNYRTEWWYVVGHLFTQEGRRFGIHVTFFRHGISSKGRRILTEESSAWRTNEVHFAHFGVTDESAARYYHAERITRPVHSRSDVSENLLKLQNSGWWLRCDTNSCGDGSNESPFTAQFHASDRNFEATIQLRAAKPLVLQGQKGLSQKSSEDGNASHYYSFTRLQATGTITIEGVLHTVTGICWMDREFSTSALGSNQFGWDWFAIQLDDNRELMLYHIRTSDSSYDPLSKGLLVYADGSTEVLTAADDYSIRALSTWRSSKTGGTYPAAWEIRLPRQNLHLTLQPILADQELILKGLGGLAYWEGACRVSGTSNQQPIKGSAYAELTGYAGDIAQALRR